MRDCLARIKSLENLSQMIDPNRATSMIIAITMGLLTSSNFPEIPCSYFELNQDIHRAKIWINYPWNETCLKYVLIVHHPLYHRYYEEIHPAGYPLHLTKTQKRSGERLFGQDHRIVWLICAKRGNRAERYRSFSGIFTAGGVCYLHAT